MATSTNLPSTRRLLTCLISTIATSTRPESDETPASNPLASACPNTKSALLTLHTLFPNDFLPALDLLDSGLVTRFVLAPEPSTNAVEVDTKTDERRKSEDANSAPPKRQIAITYQVRSAQQQKSHPRSRTANTTTATTTYEVRLTAWSCSCPAFAFATFPAEAADVENRDEDWSEGDADSDLPGRFGGLTRGRDVPVCKHLLACVVAERCEGFAALVEEREVGREEVAGWAAGWGD